MAQQKLKFVTEKQLELARFETVLETAYKEAREKFNLKVDELPEDNENTTHKRSMLEAIIKDLTQKIAELGPVNERAVEEFLQLFVAGSSRELTTKQRLNAERRYHNDLVELAINVKGVRGP